MVAYSFKKQFAAPILAGTKAQTIRADRKRHARPGETMQLYTGMRTRVCRLIGTATCESIHPVTINLQGNFVEISDVAKRGWEGLEAFARADGFDGWLSMRAFWAENHPGVTIFSGMLVRWLDFQPG